MPCYYCDSPNHDFRICYLRYTDEFQSKWKCNCSNKQKKYDDFWMHSEKCKNQKIGNQKCYICFERFNHPTECCPHQSLIAKKFFLPKIDADLIGRFSETWNPFHRYFMALNSSSDKIRHIKLVPLDIVTHPKGPDSSSEISTLYKIPLKFSCSHIFDHLWQKLYIKCDVAEFKDESNPRIPVIQFLFFTLKTLRLSDVQVNPAPSFVEIISRLPLLESIEVENSNIEIPNSWPKEILEYINGKTLETIKLRPVSLDFNVEDLISIIKEKSKQKVRITLTIPDLRVPYHERALEDVTTKMGDRFSGHTRKAQNDAEMPVVSIYAQKFDQSSLCINKFSLKEDLNNKRKRL